MSEIQPLSTLKGVNSTIFLRAIALTLAFATLLGGAALPATSRPALAAPDAPQPVFLPLVNRINPLKTVFGIEMYDIVPGSKLEAVSEAGVSWVRRNALFWSTAEPREGAYDWAALATLEQELINAQQNGMDVILVVRRTPEWAQKYPGSFCGPIRDDKIPAFADFLYQAVRRYSFPPYNVKYWQIWNEPDVDHNYVPADHMYGCWGNSSDPYYGGSYYADVLAMVYPRVKQANPQAQVLVGGLLLGCNMAYTQTCHYQGMNYLEGVLRHDGKYDGGRFFDGVAFHTYDDYYGSLGEYGNAGWQSTWFGDGPSVVVKARFIREVLARYGVSGKYLMNTETALRACQDSADQHFEETKAYYVAQLYAASIGEGMRATVWYALNEPWCNVRLLGDNNAPTPAFNAYRFARNELLNSTPMGYLNSYPNLKGYQFNRGDRHIWVIWSVDGASHSISLPQTPLAVWDVFGNPAPFSGTSLQVGVKPLYVEWYP